MAQTIDGWGLVLFIAGLLAMFYSGNHTLETAGKILIAAGIIKILYAKKLNITKA